MATKQTFEQTARIVRTQVEAARMLAADSKSWEGGYAIGAINTLEQTAREFTRVYSLDNPRFDAARFMTACGF